MAPVSTDSALTTLTLNPSPNSTPSPDTDKDSQRDCSDKPSKPRPITSCAACRTRKVKCNRASPCSACIARKTESECTYATTMEEREAIAQADLIAELRTTRNKLQNQLAKAGAGAGSAGFGSGTSTTSTSTSSGMYARDEEEEEALEAVYAALRGGSLDLVREVVGRIRAGEGVRDVLGWLEGGVVVGVGVGVGVGGIAVSVERD